MKRKCVSKLLSIYSPLRADTIVHEKLGCSNEVLEDYFTNLCKIKDTSTNLALGYVNEITYKVN